MEDTKQQEYLLHELSSEDELATHVAPPAPPAPRTTRLMMQRVFYVVATIIFVALAVFFGAHAGLLSGGSINKSHWKECGTSPLEARELGCHFDIMMYAWVPEECYNKQMLEEYLATYEFHFYSDSAATQEVPLEIAQLGEFESLWTGYAQHVLHCTYIWKLLSISATTKGPFDSMSISFEHASHCSNYLLKGLPWKESSVGNETQLIPDFISCDKY